MVVVMMMMLMMIQQEFEACGRHFPASAVAGYGRQMVSAVRILHEKRLVFVDLKPENFMLGIRGTPEEDQVRHPRISPILVCHADT
jgi:casein kinase 1